MSTIETAVGQIRLGWGPINIANKASQAISSKKIAYPTLRVTWPKPKKNPEWQEQAEVHLEILAQHRKALTQSIDIEIGKKSLRMVALFLTEKTEVPFFLNLPELDLLGIDPDTPVSIKATTTLGEFLSLMLGPFELTYQIRLGGIEITSRDAAETDPAVECYDLRWVIPSSDLVKPLVETVMESIDPDTWIRSGGTSTCMLVGHVMVISAPETTHEKIKLLLANLARFRPDAEPRECDSRASALQHEP